ncbi:type II toxin-antitoxin system RelE/ParE family toxin [Saccharospirillum sp. HFRX-1]|uniref:type II toxin-antitoxin system RelE/ParE family toxin n=1 Tax=unclassified Saccharospirillum TaxID=2633430 RepID=UPI003721F0EE
MRVFKNRSFHRWADKESLTDALLWQAIHEIERGLVDASLGGKLFKKRIAGLAGGKRGGYRTILAYRAGNKAFFIYGFAKNARANIRTDELRALQRYAMELFGYSEAALEKALRAEVLIEVKADG